MTDTINLARRRRVQELAERMGLALKEQISIAEEAHDDGIEIAEIADLAGRAIGHSADTVRKAIDGWARITADDDTIGTAAMAEVAASPWRTLLFRLFEEAEKRDGGPAFECTVVLRTFPTPVPGVLTIDATGLLKLASPTQIPQRGPGNITLPPKTMMVEQYFDLDDVVTISLLRGVTQEGSKLTIS